ncbi:hypothetical protein SGLAM104S_02192 [Streptomyces glaucescens]
MIVALIIACEVGFWVLLALGLAVRYLLKWRRTSNVLLLCEPVLELVLFVATAVDLKNGAEPGWDLAGVAPVDQRGVVQQHQRPPGRVIRRRVRCRPGRRCGR